MRNSLSSSRLLTLMRDAKSGLLREAAQQEGRFRDAKDGTCSLYSDCMGAISLLLLIANDCESEGKRGLFADGSIQQAVDVVKKVILQTHQYMTEHNGVFSADTIVDYDDTPVHYIDTVTLVLSIAALVTYIDEIARDKGLFSAEDLEKVYDIYATSLRIILDSQLTGDKVEGAWGAVYADNNGQPDTNGVKLDLYATYSVGITLADVFDYTMGEINAAKNEATNPKLNGAANEVMKKVYKKLHPNVKNDSEVWSGASELIYKLQQSRKQLALWLIYSVLPNLLSLCELRVSPNDVSSLIGARANIPVNGSKDYNNLYYVYYIINLLVSCNADNYYRLLANDTDEQFVGEALFYGLQIGINETTQFEKHFIDICRAAWSEGTYTSLFNYYFKNDSNKTHLKALCMDILNQTIHVARSNLSEARRTGTMYWENPKRSMLAMTFDMSNLDTQMACQVLSDKVNDASLIPLAVRAEVNYCYYIAESADAVTESYFDYLINTVIIGKDEDGFGLWDRDGYNINITERCIEALVDYADYLSMYGEKTSFASSQQTESVTIDSLDQYINKLIDQKIEQRLNTTHEVTPVEYVQDGEVADPIVVQLTDIIRNAARFINCEVPKSTADLDINVRTLYPSLRDLVYPNAFLQAQEYEYDSIVKLNGQLTVLYSSIIKDMVSNQASFVKLVDLYQALKKVAEIQEDEKNATK